MTRITVSTPSNALPSRRRELVAEDEEGAEDDEHPVLVEADPLAVGLVAHEHADDARAVERRDRESG